MNTDTNNLFRLNPLLLRLHVQKFSTKNITHIRNDWDWEAAKGPPRSSSQAATQYLSYAFVLIKCANQETLVDNLVYKIIRRIALSIITKYQNTRCLVFV